MDFLSTLYLTLDLIGLAFISSIILEWKSLKPEDKLMAWYIILSVLVDASATHVEYIYGYNSMLYAIFAPLKFALILFAYAEINKSGKTKLIYYGLIVLSSFWSVFEQMVVKKPYPDGEYYLTVSSIVILVCSYIEVRKFILFKSNIDRSFVFWIAISLFIFYSVTVSVLSSSGYIFGIAPEVASVLYKIIRYFGPIVLLTQYFGFLWSTTWNKSYSS